MSPAWFENYVRFISMIQIQFDRINQREDDNIGMYCSNK